MFEENIGIFLSFFQTVKILPFFVRFCRLAARHFTDNKKTDSEIGIRFLVTRARIELAIPP